MTLEERWNSLDADIRKWLTQNPGCVVLPRTIVNAINNATRDVLPASPHGEASLTPRDQAFLREQAAPAPEPWPHSAPALAQDLARTAAALESATAADGTIPGACGSVLEHLVPAERSVESTLRHLAAAYGGQTPRGHDQDPVQCAEAAAELEAAALAADRLLERLARAFNALP